MRALLFVTAVLWLLPEPVDAQVIRFPASAHEVDYSISHADARYVANVGMGITLSGIGSVATASALWGVLYQPWSDVLGIEIILGPTFWTVGGALLLAGIPTWIAGGVRAAIAGQSNATARLREADTWETAGIVLFFAGFGVTVIGATMLGIGRDQSDAGITLGGGLVLPIGVLAGLFMGAPMWAEGARF